MGHSAAANDKKSQCCNGCGRKDSTYCCSGCMSVRYCHRECQKGHWSQHKVLCASIQHLQKDASAKCEEACSFVSHLTPTQRRRIAKVIGEKCIIQAQIGGNQTDVLWDTGSQICLISRQWLEVNNIEADIQDLKELVGNLRIEGVGGFAVPYDGFVVLKFKISETESPIEVPFLVTAEKLQNPIVGYSVISALVEGDGEDGEDQGERNDRIRKIFAQSGRTVDAKSVEALSKVLSTADTVSLSSVRVPKEGCVIKAGSVETIACKVNSIAVEKRTPVIFEPESEELLPDGIKLQPTIVHLKKGANTRVSVMITNTSARDVNLTGRLQLGEIESTASVVPVEVRKISGGVNNKPKVSTAQAAAIYADNQQKEQSGFYQRGDTEESKLNEEEKKGTA